MVLSLTSNVILNEIFYDVDFWNGNDYLVSLVTASDYDEFCVVNGNVIVSGDNEEIWNGSGVPYT